MSRKKTKPQKSGGHAAETSRSPMKAPPTARVPAPYERALPYVVGTVVLLASLPMLARAPLSGDGAEQVMTAVHGGVLHPPGFPLQGMLARLFGLVPMGLAATRLALMSALAHAAATAVLVHILGLLGASVVARVVGGLAFAAFPPVWGAATQPEVFALTHLMMALLVAQFVALVTRRSTPTKLDALLVGALVGAAGAQHQLTILFAPAFLGSLFLLARDRPDRATRLLLAGGAFLVVFVGLYASLALANRGVVWPNWGDLSSPSAIVRHALRTEYGTFELMKGTSDATETFHGLGFFLSESIRAWSVLLLAVPFGVVVLARHEGRRALLVGLGGSGLAGLVFLAYATSRPPVRFAEGILERFDGAAVIVLALLIGLGVGELLRSASSSQGRAVLFLLATAALVNLGIRGHVQADASADNTADVFRRAFGATLPPDAVFLTHEDLEGFYGAERPDGTIRFPIIGTIQQEWYRRRVLPVIEPRLADLANRDSLTIRDIVDTARARHLVVASTNQHIASPTRSRPSQLRGLFFVAADGLFDQLGPETVDAAVGLCPFAAELGPLPDRGHFSARQVRGVLFARAFEGASIFLRRVGLDEDAERAATVQRALEDGRDPTTWRRGCDAFARAIARFE